ncbi:MAG: head-tail connector protein [Planctomycetota bacterium]
MEDRSYKVKTQPVLEPVGVEEVKLWARIDHDREDKQIESLIKTARELIELYLGRALIYQTWELAFDAWPSDGLGVELPVPPLVSITELRSLAEDGTPTVLSSEYYYVDNRAEPGRVYLMPDASICTTRAHRGVEIEYLAGYGATGASVPESIRQAIKQLALELYETREADTELSDKVKRLLRPFKVVYV